jgi:hypothetical protein
LAARSRSSPDAMATCPAAMAGRVIYVPIEQRRLARGG